MDEQDDSFIIEIGLIDDQTKSKILVIPASLTIEGAHSTRFVTVLDGVTLATIQQGDDAIWQQVEGNLDLQTVEKIADAIEARYL